MATPNSMREGGRSAPESSRAAASADSAMARIAKLTSSVGASWGRLSCALPEKNLSADRRIQSKTRLCAIAPMASASANRPNSAGPRK